METNEIRTLLEKADKAEDKAGSKYRWNAAKAISEALVGGKSQRRLAKEIGRDESLVRRYRQVWDEFGADPGPHSSFQASYRAVQTSSKATAEIACREAEESFSQTVSGKEIAARREVKEKALLTPMVLLACIAKAGEQLSKIPRNTTGMDDATITLLQDQLEKLRAEIDEITITLSKMLNVDAELETLFQEI